MLKITYFVHGTTTDNEQGIATGWDHGELSALGIQQSKKLGELMANKKFDAIFCSDLKRAVDSAQLMFDNKYEIITDERLREANYGDFNGKRADFKGNLKKYIEERFPAGENFQDVEKRVAEFLKDASQKYFGKHVAIIAHQAPQLALEVLLNNKTWEQALDEDWRHAKAWQPGWEYIMNNVYLNKATIDDAPIVEKIENGAAGKYYSTLHLSKLLAYLNNGTVYFIMKGNETAGVLSYNSEEDGRIYVSGLVVLPTFRGQGVGKAAMNLFIKELGDKKSWLVVHPNNSVAVNLYKSLGFVAKEQKENYYGDGEPRLIMERD